MKLRSLYLVAASLLAATAIAAPARIERVVEKTFSVQAGGKLHVKTQGGEIRVEPGPDGVVKITARQKIRASSEAEADELLKKHQLVFEQAGNDVSASSNYEARLPGLHWGSWPPVQVDFIVTAPASFATDLQTAGGGITVGNLNAAAKARTSGGAIKLGKIGAGVDAHTSGGSVTLEGAKGEVKLATSGGNITVGRVEGPAALSTSGGSIKIEAVTGSLKAHTSGGSIRAGVTGPLEGDSMLETSGGSVRVTVDRTAAFRLDAATSGGSVNAEGLTITLEKSGRDRSRLTGSVNGGGPTLKLRASGGSIDVKAL